MRRVADRASLPTISSTTARRRFLTSLPRRRSDRTPVDEARGYWIRVHRYAMACRFEITLADEDAAFVPAARTALDEIDRLEEELSVFRETSTISDSESPRGLPARRRPAARDRPARDLPAASSGDGRRF